MTGRALIRALEQSGIETAGTYHARPTTDATLQLDVRDRTAVDECLSSVKPDAVFLAVNSAGGVDYCESHPDEARTVHVMGARNVAIAASRCRATVVYYSTDYLFDGESGPYYEEDESAPLNAYGHCKWEAEELIREITPKHLIIRTTAVFGWDRTSKNFAMQLWEQLQAGKTMRVANDQWCNPTLVDYLAEASVRLVQAGATGIVNVVGKDRMPRSDLAVALAKTMALDPDLIVPVPTADLGAQAPGHSKAASTPTGCRLC